jgi:streptogramin lyase
MHPPVLSSPVLRRTVLSMLVGILSLPTLAQSGVGSGPRLGGPSGMALEASGSFVVTDEGLDAVLRVDPVTGDRTIVSDASTGRGPALRSPQGIAVEASGRLVVVNYGRTIAAVLRVDPATGDRTVVSGCPVRRPVCPPGREGGSGPRLDAPLDIVVEPTGRLVVVDVKLDAVLRVDPDTGDRTVVSQ